MNPIFRLGIGLMLVWSTAGSALSQPVQAALDFYIATKKASLAGPGQSGPTLKKVESDWQSLQPKAKAYCQLVRNFRPELAVAVQNLNSSGPAQPVVFNPYLDRDWVDHIETALVQECCQKRGSQ